MCKIHAVRRRLHLLREFICKSYWGWREVSLYLFPFFFPPLEEMQEEQHLLETFVLESCDSLHFQNNLPYRNACNG